MANQENLAILMQGVEVWNEWRGENPQILSELESTDLEVRRKAKSVKGRRDNPATRPASAVPERRLCKGALCPYTAVSPG
jgi:hypothetical protein